jgi:hypothetical protein
MSTETDTIVVELVAFGQAKEYQQVTLAEAREILARPMARGHYWHIPTWQFDDGDTAATILLERAAAARRAVEGAA